MVGSTGVVLGGIPSLPAPAVTPELIERMLEAGTRHSVEWLP